MPEQGPLLAGLQGTVGGFFLFVAADFFSIFFKTGMMFLFKHYLFHSTLK